MVHKYRMNGFCLALDVDSGTVHILDRLTYDLLDFADETMPEELPERALSALRGQYDEAEMKEAWEEIASLHRKGLLFSKENYQKYTKACEKAPIKSMCLNIAHDCNLRCGYCFASTGDFGGGRKLMPLETGKKAIDFLIANSGTRRNLEVDFFGGEPLMNFDVVRRTVEYARSLEKEHQKNFRFTITTNGMLLDDDKIDFINREMYNVVLSIDGRREVNDRMRKRVDGTGSYDAILRNFKRLCEKRNYENYYVRGTYTRYNLDFSRDVLHLYEQGFDQISVEPVVADPEAEYAIRKEDLPAIFAEYEKLAGEIIRLRKENRSINFFHYMIDLDEGPCAIKLLRGCGCGNEYVAVTPEGGIYPCHQFVGQTEWRMGNVHDVRGQLECAIKDRFAGTHIFSKRGCGDCWAKFFCSGGCNANNALYQGDVLAPYEITCQIERKRLECAIMIKAALSA